MTISTRCHDGLTGSSTKFYLGLLQDLRTNEGYGPIKFARTSFPSFHFYISKIRRTSSVLAARSGSRSPVGPFSTIRAAHPRVCIGKGTTEKADKNKSADIFVVTSARECARALPLPSNGINSRLLVALITGLHFNPTLISGGATPG